MTMIVATKVDKYTRDLCKRFNREETPRFPSLNDLKEHSEMFREWGVNALKEIEYAENLAGSTGVFEFEWPELFLCYVSSIEISSQVSSVEMIVLFKTWVRLLALNDQAHHVTTPKPYEVTQITRQFPKRVREWEMVNAPSKRTRLNAFGRIRSS